MIFVNRQMLWRYSYVITMNGRPLDVSRHSEVRRETLTASLNFTSPSNINYVAVDAQVGSYEEMFSLQVENIQNTEKSQEILGELSSMWSKHSGISDALIQYCSINPLRWKTIPIYVFCIVKGN